MSFTCRFIIRSNGYQGITHEQYKMPCQEATEFLKKFSTVFKADGQPLHEVQYEISKDLCEFKSRTYETPDKAVAKIELYMKDSGLLWQVKLYGGLLGHDSL